MPTLLKSLKKRREKKSDSSFRTITQDGNNTGSSSPVSPTSAVAFDGSEWHRWVHSRDWDHLLAALKEDPKEDAAETNNNWSPKRQLSKRFSKRRLSNRSRGSTDEVQPLSSLLLSRDSSGDTVLHLALKQEDTPTDVLIELIRANPDLSATENGHGQLALHLAVRQQNRMEAIAELVIANPAGVMFADRGGCTPLDFAVETAKQHFSAVPQTYRRWDRVAQVEDDDDEVLVRWQTEQNSRWAVVKWLLVASASHPRTSLNLLNRQSLLLEALLHSAPPSVISLLIAASASPDESRGQSTSFNCSALYLCIMRRYPPPILESLASRCPPQAQIVRDETGMGLVSAQYIVGCFHKAPGEDWAVRPKHMEAIEHCLSSKSAADCNPAFIDWWEKVKFLVGYCRNFTSVTPEKHLLHAALANSDTPPSVVQLLLSLHPESLAMPDPLSGAHPLHLACITGTYVPRNYEPPTPDTGTALAIVLKASPKAVRYRFHGKTPLHLAIEAGKTWKEIKPLTSVYRKSLALRDPTTMLYPFLMAAMKRDYTADDKARLAYRARNSCSHDVWRDMSAPQQEDAVRQTVEREELERLRTIYEFLRRNPSLVKGGIVKPTSVHEVRDSTGMGMVAAHYTVWCYTSEKEHWRPLMDNQRMLRNTIATGSLEVDIHDDRTKAFESWFTKLKFWIWYCYRGEEGSTPREGTIVMPRTDEFLLHAASSNSDAPPQVINLLLSLFPSSASIPLPRTEMYPLHIAAATTSYTPRAFEPEFPSTLNLLLRAFPKAVRLKCDGRLPIHICIEAGKTWDELKILVEADKRALRYRDPSTGLLPYQLMALRHAYTPEQRRRFQYLARNRNELKTWEKMSQHGKSRETTLVQKEHQLNVLSSVYELLRKDPTLVDIRIGGDAVESNAASPSALLDAPGIGDTPSPSGTPSPPHRSTDDSKVLMPRQVAPAARSSQLLGESVDNDASMFSTIDVLSTISALHGEEQASSRQSRGSDRLAVHLGGHKMGNGRSSDATLQIEIPFDEKETAVVKSECPVRRELDCRSIDAVQPGQTVGPNVSEKGSNLDSADADLWSYVQQMEKQFGASNTRATKETDTSNTCTDDALSPSTNQHNHSFIARETASPPPPQTSNPQAVARTQFMSLHDQLTEISVKPKAASPSRKSPAPNSLTAGIAEASGKSKATQEIEKSLDPDRFNELIAEAPGHLKHTTSTVPSRIASDPLSAKIAEVSGNLKHSKCVHEESHKRDLVAEAITKATDQLKHSPPTNPERRPLFVEKDRDEVTDVERRVGVYRTGWTSTPALLNRKRRSFGNYVTTTKDKGLPCVLCGKGKREVLMLPCRHLCLCSHCSVAQRVIECQTCGKKVDSWMTVFL